MKFFLLLSLLSMACISSLRAQKDSVLVTIQGDTVRCESGEGFNVFTQVEVEPFFPGGARAWHRFLQKNLVYPDSVSSEAIEGRVLLQFIVYKDGRICNLKAVGGVEILKEAALATMRKSPRWEPGSFSGRYVTCYKKEYIVFRISDESDEPNKLLTLKP